MIAKLTLVRYFQKTPCLGMVFAAFLMLVCQQNVFSKAVLMNELYADSLVRLYGQVLDIETEEPVYAQIIVEMLPNGDDVFLYRSQPNSGDYQLFVRNKKSYTVRVKAKGYQEYYENIEIAEGGSNEGFKKILLLTPNIEGQIMRLEKLIFVQSKAEIEDDSFGELDRLASLMKENEDLVIQLEGHTDNTGSPVLNQRLSERRVAAIKKYLVEQGIKRRRIKTKAFGGSQPLSNENTEEAKQANRRVEIIVLKD